MAGISAHVERLRWAEGLVLVFPTWWFNRLFMGDPGRHVLKRGLAALLSPKARRIYLAQYGMDKATEESRRRFGAKVERKLGSL